MSKDDRQLMIGAVIFLTIVTLLLGGLAYGNVIYNRGLEGFEGHTPRVPIDVCNNPITHKPMILNQQFAGNMYLETYVNKDGNLVNKRYDRLTLSDIWKIRDTQIIAGDDCPKSDSSKGE